VQTGVHHDIQTPAVFKHWQNSNTGNIQTLATACVSHAGDLEVLNLLTGLSSHPINSKALRPSPRLIDAIPDIG